MDWSLCRVAVGLLLIAVAGTASSGEFTGAGDPTKAGHFQGRVAGPDGQPLKDVRIYVVAWDRNSINKDVETAGPVRAVTDAAGRFAFDAPEMTVLEFDDLPARRRCLLIAAADGYGPDWIIVGGQSPDSGIRERILETEMVFQLAPEGVPVRGRLLDSAGYPLVDAQVRVASLSIPKQRDLDAHLDHERKVSALGCSSGYERLLRRADLLPGVVTETQTDADGRFTMSGLGSDRLVELQITSPDIVDTRTVVMTRDTPAVGVRPGLNKQPTSSIYGANFTLSAKSGRTITGVVRDRTTGRPIAGMLVGTGRSGYPRDGAWNHISETDASGRFAVSGLDLDVERWSLTAMSPPGGDYQSASIDVHREGSVVLECDRGIPFHLTVLDEQHRPVKAEVVYFEVRPNPDAPRVFNLPSHNPISTARRNGDGTYTGFALPGPGAVFVKLAGRDDYLPPYLDPKAFFAPDRTDWEGTKEDWWYGSHDTIETVMGSTRQDDYAAIVLVNPDPGAAPLELTATVRYRPPRLGNIVDPEGHPVVGVQTQGMTERTDVELPLRGSSFRLPKLHPKRIRPITFVKEDRGLIAFLAARGDDDTPYTVILRRWAAVAGQIFDHNNRPLADVHVRVYGESITGSAGYIGAKTDDEGRFRIDRLVPGVRYDAGIYLKKGRFWKEFAGPAFENFVPKPGEQRDLGKVRAGSRSVTMSTPDGLELPQSQDFGPYLRTVRLSRVSFGRER